MPVKELNFDPDNLRYTSIIGTGGIGSGKVFELNGNHTLGREESRSGHFLDINDYCKQHIILHYIKVLLGPSFSAIPIGMIGNDDIGEKLFNELRETGLDTKYVKKVPNFGTLFSICFSYPDGTGCNLTTDDSASSQVDTDFIETAIPYIRKSGSAGIVMAAPEVSLVARQKLLKIGKQHDLFCSASFNSAEINEALNQQTMTDVDLIAINIDEASALVDSELAKAKNEIVVQSAVKKLCKENERIIVTVTAGKQGSWCWDGNALNYFPAIKTNVVNSAGAGDAFFSGILCGIALGLTLFDAQQLATLIAGLSVTSPHTINKEINRHSLYRFMNACNQDFPEIIKKLLED